MPNVQPDGPCPECGRFGVAINDCTGCAPRAGSGVPEAARAADERVIVVRMDDLTRITLEVLQKHRPIEGTTQLCSCGVSIRLSGIRLHQVGCIVRDLLADAEVAVAVAEERATTGRRIEAALSDHVAQMLDGGRAQDWHCICGWRADFLHLQKFRWLVDHREHVAASIVAALTSPGEGKADRADPVVVAAARDFYGIAASPGEGE